jgi:WD40 repeat protein
MASSQLYIDLSHLN